MVTVFSESLKCLSLHCFFGQRPLNSLLRKSLWQREPLSGNTQSPKTESFRSFQRCQMCVSSRQELGDRESRGPECCPAPYLMVEPCLLPFGNNMPQISRKQEEYSRTGIFPSRDNPDYYKKHQQFLDRQVDIVKIHASIYSAPPPRGTAKRLSGTRSQAGQSLRPFS